MSTNYNIHTHSFSLNIILQLGSCPNAFEGCIPNVNCPYSANVMTSKCDSSATVAEGVYSIYLTAKECCESHFYWNIDACLASPPTSSPPTTRPSVVEQQTPIDNIVGPQQIKPLPDGDTVGILLAPIYIRFSNMQSQLQLDEEDREQLQDIIRRSLLVASDEFNITIVSVDAVDSIFSNENDQSISMSMYLKITISGEDVDPREVQIAFTNALQDQIYLIDNEIQNSWGSSSNNMVLGIGETGGDIVSTRISNESSSSVPVWGIILIILLFAFLCGGLLVLQRRRLDNKGDSLPRHTNESYFDREKSQPCEEGRYNPRDRQHISKRNQQHSRSFNQSQQTLTSRGDGDEIIVHHNKPDPDGEKSFNKSMSFTQSALNINEEPIEQSSKRIEGIQRKRSSESGMRRKSSQEHDVQINRSFEREQRSRGQEELEEEDGYDGGQSSFFITNDNDEGQESSDDSSEEINSSDDDVGVLGLMYYDGASSAGESLGAKESRLSRRSKRSAARSKSTKSRASSRVSQSQQQPPPIARKKEGTKRKEQHQNVTVDGQKDYPYVLQPPYNKRQSDHSDNIYIGGESSVVSGLSSNAEDFNHHDDARAKLFNKSSTIVEELD